MFSKEMRRRKSKDELSLLFFSFFLFLSETFSVSCFLISSCVFYLFPSHTQTHTLSLSFSLPKWQQKWNKILHLAIRADIPSGFSFSPFYNVLLSVIRLPNCFFFLVCFLSLFFFPRCVAEHVSQLRRYVGETICLQFFFSFFLISFCQERWEVSWWKGSWSLSYPRVTPHPCVRTKTHTRRTGKGGEGGSNDFCSLFFCPVRAWGRGCPMI